MAVIIAVMSKSSLVQTSASAPLLQGAKKAVRVSMIAMGAAPLAPKAPEPEPEPEALALKEEKVSHLILVCQQMLFCCTTPSVVMCSCTGWTAISFGHGQKIKPAGLTPG